jgi:branched-chain amino acid transport system permease protein
VILGQAIVDGLVLGSGCALIAVGWSVLLGATRLANLAHGPLYMLGAFVAWAAMQRYAVDYYVAVALAVVAVAVLGMVLQFMMLPRMRQQSLTNLMIVTLAFGYILQAGANRVVGGAPQRLVSPLQTESIRFADVSISQQDAAIVVAALLLFALSWWVMNRTRLGMRVRAVTEDPGLAPLFGISTRWVYVGAFVYEGAAVALAAGLVAPRGPILPVMGFDELILTIVVVTLGGIGSIGGCLLAGLGLGLFITLFGVLVSPAWTTVAAFLLLVIVLLARPRSLAIR